jgi:hypothetical protein
VEELFKNLTFNFWDIQRDFGSSLAKNVPSEELSGEEFSASGDFFRAKNYPAKNFPP